MIYKPYLGITGSFIAGKYKSNLRQVPLWSFIAVLYLGLVNLDKINSIDALNSLEKIEKTLSVCGGLSKAEVDVGWS